LAAAQHIPAVVADRSHGPVEAAPILMGDPASKVSHLIDAWRDGRAVLRRAGALAFVTIREAFSLRPMLLIDRTDAAERWLGLVRLRAIMLVAAVLLLVAFAIICAAIAFPIVTRTLLPSGLVGGR
jgi:hypothetical protein